jgi:hypothetical protein
MIRLKESTKEIYGNYQVYSPDGVLMFRTDQKKINWYLSRGLATRISDNSISLLFEPMGLGLHGREYGLTQMKNICVVCGSESELTKHHVVPRCYRSFFPEEYRSHKFHDVLVTCVGCHYTYEEEALKYKKEISQKYDCPIDGIIVDRSREKKIKNFILCLEDKNIPKWRISQIKSEIRRELNIKRITRSVIKEWSNKVIKNFCSVSNGEMVVQKIENLDEFIRDWRSHFIQTMDPKFLPEGWSINNRD